MKRVLVVGGAGYVGGAVTDHLQEQEHDVRVYDNLLYEESYRKPGDFVYGDVRDQGLLKQLLDWADVVIWLAAIVGDGACALNPELTVAINENSVRWLSENYDGRIIFTSSCSVYGANDSVLNEESEVRPLSLYAGTKVNAEGHLFNKNAIIFRLGTLFGVGDNFARIRMDLVVNYLTARAYSSGKITVFGGEQHRPLLHVQDVATAIVKNLDTHHTGIFNLHSANTTITGLASHLKAHFPELNIEKTDVKFQDNRNYRVSSEKAKSVFDFHPIHTLDQGIEEIHNLMKTNRIKDVFHPRYSNHEFLKGLADFPKGRLDLK
jgi:nucleoside-diphosphate-sugar epimerase